MTLGEYLAAATRTRWKAGEHDCSAWPARWAGIALPDYATDEQAIAIVEAGGGLVAVWERCIGDRLKRVDHPEAGDIGIVETVGEDMKLGHVGAIFTGGRWAILTPRRVMFAPVEAVAVWRVERPNG